MIKTTLCYIRDDQNRYLMLFRNKKKNDLNACKWVGVGGKFEAGESPEECLKREVYEETGLRLTGFHFHGIIRFISDTWEDEDMYLYTGTSFEGSLTGDCNEGELHWIPAEKIMDLNLWEGDRYFLEPLIRGEEHINMTITYHGDDLVGVSADPEGCI